MNKDSKIYIAGHMGLVGSSLVRKFKKEGFINIIGHTAKEPDLRNQAFVDEYFQINQSDYVIHAAGKVEGIKANNTYRAEFIYDNIMMEIEKNENFILDMKILLITFKNVLFRKGISPKDKIIMDEFLGNKIN